MTTRIAVSRPIATLDDLREHLQWAIELEHATLPPYLCALYSLDPARNPEAVAVVSGVFVEEMLHLTLAANILIAVGGRPRLDSPAMLPPHPRGMQGEGSGPDQVWDGDADPFRPGQGEIAHYYRFQELKLRRRYQPGDTARTGPTGEALLVDLDGVRPMRPNPRLDDHPVGHPIRVAQEEFNRSYCSLLGRLEQAFNGRPDQLAIATRTMFAVKAQAEALMQMPDGPDRTAGPSFEYVPPELRHSPAEPLVAAPGIGSASITTPDGRR